MKRELEGNLAERYQQGQRGLSQSHKLGLVAFRFQKKQEEGFVKCVPASCNCSRLPDGGFFCGLCAPSEGFF